MPKMTRREAMMSTVAASLASLVGGPVGAENDSSFRLRFTVASCMYGYAGLEEILPEVRKCGAESIDLWPKVHGNQREQVDEMGVDAFLALIERHQMRVDVISAYRFNAFELRPEIEFAKSVRCPMIVTMAKGPNDLSGAMLGEEIKKFVQGMRPHVDYAAERGVTLLIENHSGSLISSVEAIERLVDQMERDHMRLAFAPAHLAQDASLLGRLVDCIGDRMGFFYAWQYGKGFREKMPREDELLQMPGRGPLDFGPMIDSLKRSGYKGLVEVMMHPTPRGIPIMPSTPGVTTEISLAHDYLRSLA